MLTDLLALSHVPHYWLPPALDPGTITLDVPPTPAGLLELMQTAAASDGGALFCTAAGVITYRSRATLEADEAIRATFTDHGTGPTDLCPTSITLGSDGSRVVNAIGVAQTKDPDDPDAPDPVAVWAEDGWSQAWFGRRPVEVNLWHTNDSDGLELARMALERASRNDLYSTPITGEVLVTPNWFDAGLGLDLLDPVALYRDDGHGRHIELASHIDAIRHDITPRSWTMTVGLGGVGLRTQYARWDRARWDRDPWT